MVPGTVIDEIIKSSIEKRRVFFERVLYTLHPKGYISKHYGQDKEILHLTDEEKLLHLTVNYAHEPIKLDDLGVIKKDGYKEQRIFFSARATSGWIPNELSDIFPYKRSLMPGLEYVWYSKEKTINLTDVQKVTVNIDSRFSELSEMLHDFKNLRLSGWDHHPVLPFDPKKYEHPFYSSRPDYLDIYAEFYQHYYKLDPTDIIAKTEIKSPSSNYYPVEILSKIQKLAAKYVRDSKKMTDTAEYYSFFDYLIVRFFESDVNVSESSLLEYLTMHDEENEVMKIQYDGDVNDTAFIPLLVGLHKYPINPDKLKSLESNLIKIVTLKKLAELVAREVLENPICYSNPEERAHLVDPFYTAVLDEYSKKHRKFHIYNFLISDGFRHPNRYQDNNPYYQLLFGLSHWTDLLESFDKGSKAYKLLVNLLPEEFMKSETIDDLFLSLLPANLQKYMEYLYEGTFPAVVRSQILTKQEKVRILLRLPGLDVSEEEILPKLNLGMVHYDATSKMSSESINSELSDLVIHLSPYLSRKEIVEFCSEKIIQIYLNNGFQVNREKASELMDVLQAQLIKST